MALQLCWWSCQSHDSSKEKSLKEQHVYFRIRLRDLAKLVLPGVRLDWAAYVEQRSSAQDDNRKAGDVRACLKDCISS